MGRRACGVECGVHIRVLSGGKGWDIKRGTGRGEKRIYVADIVQVSVEEKGYGEHVCVRGWGQTGRGRG